MTKGYDGILSEDLIPNEDAPKLDTPIVKEEAAPGIAKIDVKGASTQILDETLQVAIDPDKQKDVIADIKVKEDKDKDGYTKGVQQRINQLTYQKKEAERKLQEVADKNQKIENRLNKMEEESKNKEYKEKLDNLYEKRKTYIEEGELDKLSEIETEIDTTKESLLVDRLKKEMGLAEAKKEIKIPEADTEAVTKVREEFKSKFNWYGDHYVKTATANAISVELGQDPYWKTRPMAETMQEIGKRTEALFNDDPITDTDIPIESSGGSTQTGKVNVEVTQADLALTKKLHPKLRSEEILKLTRDMKANIIKGKVQ